jgi:hypothetical protein
VTVSRVNGEGRILISGGIPEAVWTECCARLNELSITFYQDAFGCWKLGGYFTVCNANLEDSDIDLMAEILLTLGQSLGYTDDKTILYGTGTNMPLGIIPRLAQTSQPAGYSPTARPWVDLHESNIRTIANTLARALPPDSPLGRTGGDEFTGLMLLRDGYSVEWLQERIRQDVERFNRKSATPWYLGISVGCSPFVYSQPSQISEELEKADQHLYQAKALRRKSVIRIPPEEP